MTALVTGSAKRLGKAMALYLAEHGHDVVVHYASSESAAQEVVEAIHRIGRRAVAVQADLLDDTATQTLIPRAVEALGPLSVLINNASIFEYDTLTTATPSSWDRHIGSNLRAPYFLIQAFAKQCPPALRDANDEPIAQGLVVNMLDQRVRKLTPAFSTYTIAKMGLYVLTQTAAQELAPHIRVNGIGPGATLRSPRQTEEHFRHQRGATILNRGAEPKDITRALGFFLESPSVTGQIILADGGQHLAWQTPDILGTE